MLALSSYPKILCIWSNTSSLWKRTNVQLGRNACNAVFQAHVCSACLSKWRIHWWEVTHRQPPSLFRGEMHRLTLPSWVSLVLLVRVWVSLLLFGFCCSLKSQASVSTLLWYNVRKNPSSSSSSSSSFPEREALQSLPIIQRFPSQP